MGDSEAMRFRSRAAVCAPCLTNRPSVVLDTELPQHCIQLPDAPGLAVLQPFLEILSPCRAINQVTPVGVLRQVLDQFVSALLESGFAGESWDMIDAFSGMDEVCHRA